MNELLYQVPGIIGIALTYFFTRKKYAEEIKMARADAEKTHADAQGLEIDNVEKVARIWRELSESMKKKFDSDIEELRLENQKTRDENVKIKEQMDRVLKENKSMSQQMATLEKELKESKAENAKLIAQLKLFSKNFKMEYELPEKERELKLKSVSHESASKGEN